MRGLKIQPSASASSTLEPQCWNGRDGRAWTVELGPGGDRLYFAGVAGAEDKEVKDAHEDEDEGAGEDGNKYGAERQWPSG